MRKGPVILCLAGLALLLPGINLGVAPHLQEARWDLTEDQLYSVSLATLKIIETLPEPVQLTLFFSSEQSSALVLLRSYTRRVEALLREYERRSLGKVKFTIVDPAPFSSEEDQARTYGLQALPIGTAEAPVYFGLVAASKADHWQSIPLLSLDEQNFLEYDISRLLQTLSAEHKPALGLISTLPLTGGFDLQARRERAPWVMVDEIAKAFEVQALSSEVQRIPDEVKVLMLVHPKRLARDTLLAIDQFVLRGGRLLVFVDPYSEQDPGELYFGIPSKDKASTLAPLFNAWGLRLRAGAVVADGEYGQYVNLPGQEKPVWQPTALTLQAEAVNQQDVVTAGLTGINLTTVGALEPLEGARTRFTPLLRSSANATSLPTSRLDHLPDPAELARTLESSGERFTFAARIEGPARSAYVKAGQATPGELSEAASIQVIAVADTDLLGDGAWVERQQRHGQVVAMPWADNGHFVLNALDNLSGSDELISLRSRGRYTRTFTVIEHLQRQARLRLNKMNAALQQRLEATDQQLAALQRDNAKNDELSEQQQQAVANFTREKQAIGVQMRQTARALNLEVEELGWMIKALNIAALPLLLSLIVLCRWAWSVLTRQAVATR